MDSDWTQIHSQSIVKAAGTHGGIADSIIAVREVDDEVRSKKQLTVRPGLDLSVFA
jgi:hypothetical protein